MLEMWTYDKLFTSSDLVAIGCPLPTRDTKEDCKLPNGPAWKVIGVETEFEIRVVMKGNKELKNILLHHYRLKSPNEDINDGPHFVWFQNDQKASYLLFLKRELDGRFVPVSGQTDPSMFSVLKLEASDLLNSTVKSAGQ